MFFPLNFLVRTSCIICGEIPHNDMGICPTCESELPFLNNCCSRCAEPISPFVDLCSHCLEIKIPNLITKAVFHYSFPIERLIKRLKFGQGLREAKVLGELMAKYLYSEYGTNEKPEMLLPIPLHAARLRERGYNQALELSIPIAKKFEIPIGRFNVIRTINTQAQAKLAAKDRGKNTRGAFSLKHEINAKHIAIIDDVITTGSTVFELARLLHNHGINQIKIWCCAKALSFNATPKKIESIKNAFILK